MINAILKNTVDGEFWRLLDDGRIECELCPRACKLQEGQRGFCFVRARENNKMVFTSYGLSSGFCIDPIEKKPLYHFLPGTPILSFGTAGCNLGCKFCQNWDISKSREFQTLSSQAAPKTLAMVAKEYHCSSVAFTYNDPVIFFEYARDTAIECHKLGIKTVAVSAGYITEKARPDFFKYFDAANIDLKAFTEDFYKKICNAHLQPVLDTLIYLKHKTNVWFEITTLLIPGENDSSEEIEQMTKWLYKNLGTDVPLHFSAFHPDYKMLDKPQTPLETLTRARNIALKNGLRYVYMGNVHNVDGDTTFCHNCHQSLIVRDWYEILQFNLIDGKCPHCGTVCLGYFEKHAGNWGRKRQPILI